MANYEIVVTDVTNYKDLFCIAGWDVNRSKMVRPEPPGANKDYEPSRFWSPAVAGPGRSFAVGNMVQFPASGPLPNFPFPHATEDCLVMDSSKIVVLGALTFKQTADLAENSLAPTLSDVFGGHLIHANSGKAYVKADTKTNSLGAIEIAPATIGFYQDTKTPPKLRAIIDEDGVEYDLAVTADSLRARWKNGGLKALKADVSNSKKLHVRVGLSRPFNAIPDKCFSQINGILFL